MSTGRIAAICIGPDRGAPMRLVREVRAITGTGLEGDRYALGNDSFNQGRPGRRQVTLINGIFLRGSGFSYTDSRRNLVVFGIELMRLIGREFTVGDALLRGISYCEPCDRPSSLKGKGDFRRAFYDRGGIIAEIISGGTIKVNDLVVLLPSTDATPVAS